MSNTTKNCLAIYPITTRLFLKLEMVGNLVLDGTEKYFVFLFIAMY